MTETSDALFERNMAALMRFHPGLHQQMAAITNPTARVLGSLEEGDINIDLGHTLLYPTDAQSHAERQLADFRASPHRFYMNPPIHHVSHKPYQHDYIAAALYEFAKDQGLPGLTKLPDATGGFLIIYGIGLGLHLPSLFDEIDVRHFILAEEFVELMFHTLRLIDWGRIFDQAAERGQTIQFFFSREPLHLAERIHWSMRGKGFGLLDGSYLFRHYSSMVLDEAYGEFREKLPLLPISMGFVEDEWVMLRQCGTNLHQQCLSAARRPPPAGKEPAGLHRRLRPVARSIDRGDQAAAGPGDHLLRGTGILPLLRNGIRPDFQCELENGNSSYDHLKRTGDQFGLHGITLIASTTVWPEMPGICSTGASSISAIRSVSTGLWAPDEYRPLRHGADLHQPGAPRGAAALLPADLPVRRRSRHARRGQAPFARRDLLPSPRTGARAIPRPRMRWRSRCRRISAARPTPIRPCTGPG
jgi:hypothetical protein